MSKGFDIPCENCGEMMIAVRRNKRFCSRRCLQDRQNEQRRKSPTYERICEGCGKKFIARRKDKRACSRQCKNNFHSRRIKRYIRHGCDWDGEFDRLWRAQDGKCYLCGNPLDQNEAACHVDHDHSCCPPGQTCEKCRRGITHPNCNRLIGYAQDDPDHLRRIAENLEAAKALVRERLTGQTR